MRGMAPSSQTTDVQDGHATCVHAMWRSRTAPDEHWWPLVIAYVFADGEMGPVVPMLARRPAAGSPAARGSTAQDREAREAWEQAREALVKHAAIYAPRRTALSLSRDDYDDARETLAAKFAEFKREMLALPHLREELRRLHFRPWRPAGWLVAAPMEAYFAAARVRAVTWADAEPAFAHARATLPEDAPGIDWLAEAMAVFARGLEYVSDPSAPAPSGRSARDWQYPPTLGVFAGDCDDLAFAAAGCWPPHWIEDFWTSAAVPAKLKRTVRKYLPWIAVGQLRDSGGPVAHAFCALIRRDYFLGKKAGSFPFAIVEGTRHTPPTSTGRTSEHEIDPLTGRTYEPTAYDVVTEIVPVDPSSVWHGTLPYAGTYTVFTHKLSGERVVGATVNDLRAGSVLISFEPTRVYADSREIAALRLIASAIPQLPPLRAERVGGEVAAASHHPQLKRHGKRMLHRRIRDGEALEVPLSLPLADDMTAFDLRFKCEGWIVDIQEHLEIE